MMERIKKEYEKWKENKTIQTKVKNCLKSS